MMIVDKGPGRPMYEVLDHTQWSSVQIPFPPEIEKAVLEVMQESSTIQDYIHELYCLLRPNSGANISQVEVPKCITDRVSRRASPPPSKSEASASSTKPTRTRSKSQSRKGG